MKSVYNAEVEYGKSIFDYIPVDKDQETQKYHYDLAINGKTTTNIHRYGLNHNKYFETYYNPVFLEGEIVGISVVSINDRTK